MSDPDSPPDKMPVEIPPRTVEEQALIDHVLKRPRLNRPVVFSSPGKGQIAPGENVKDVEL